LAGVIERAKKMNIPCKIYSRKEFLEGNEILKCLKENKVDAIILAGFLLLVPQNLIQEFPDRIINIHPALLPGHGGKGFYGANVHEAVLKTGSLISGITIHKVNEKFDEGEIIFQAACHVSKDDDAGSLSAKIHELEYKYFPVVTEKYLRSLK
jgi:phosphoribosylglycinamide formyltransferase-1